MAEITLSATTGRTTGTRSSRRLRAEGRVPGTVYGLGRDPETVTVVWRELRKALTGEDGRNAVVTLSVGGGATTPVMVKELQRHPVRRDVIHVDFLRVNLDLVMTTDVPIVLTGDAEHLIRDDAVADQVLSMLTIEAKPGNIPSEIHADVGSLQVGGVIRVGDLILPEGVVTPVDPEEAVVVASGTSASAAAEGEGDSEQAESEG
jgi:large subunit ribosomal protein L25